MFTAYCQLLRQLATPDADQWQSTTCAVAISHHQQQQRTAVNHTDAPLSSHLLHTPFVQQAQRQPHRLAVITPKQTVTYGQLWQQANYLAHHLTQLGARPNHLIAVTLDKGVEQLIAVLAILMAGAAYVPIDPSLPQARRDYLIEHTEVQLVLTNGHWNDALPWPVHLKRLCVDHTHGQCDTPLKVVQAPTDLAYVLYTSGSTGTPKGVMIDHRGAVNTLLDINQRFQISETDRVLGVSALNFDLSVYDIFGTLASGGTLVLPKVSDLPDPDHWLELMQTHHITLWNSVPALLQLLLNAAQGHGVTLASLGSVLLSGDWIPLNLPPQLHHVAPDSQLISLGGATEASIWSIYHPVDQVDPHWTSIPYGRPLNNQTWHVLNEELQPCPTWVAGQLFIGGVGLAQGYWRDQHKTQASFITHPYSKKRLYRTGDLGRYLPDGSIEFLGRVDFQVKIGGQRIELGEIEAILAQHSRVQQALITVIGAAQEQKRLVAYVVSTDEAALEIKELQEFLGQQLPRYMVPGLWMQLQQLPLSANGKVDRRALPVPAVPEDTEQTFVPPQSQVETTLATLWAQVLQVERVGRHDNFFFLGGDSILAIQFIGKAKQENLQVTPGQLYRNPTIAELAQVATSAVTPPISESESLTGEIPLTPIQHWLIEQNRPSLHHANLALLLQAKSTLAPDLLKTAFQAVFEHHDVFRLRFEVQGAKVQQFFIDPGEEINFTRVDLSAQLAEKQRLTIEEISDDVQRSLNLSAGPLLRAVWFDLGPTRPARLLIVAHHLIVDGVSLRILVEDLQSAYQQLTQNVPIQLAAKTASYQAWSEQLAIHARTHAVQQELTYWLETLPQQISQLPSDYPNGVNSEASIKQVTRSFTKEETDFLLRKLPRAHDAQIHEILLAALSYTLCNWMKSPSVLINLAAHGREAALSSLDVTRTVGWFSSTYPAYFDLDNSQPWEQVLAYVTKTLRQVPNHGSGYGLLRYLCPDVASQLRSLPHAEVGFNYFGQFDQSLSEHSLFQMASESFGSIFSPEGTRTHVIDVTGFITQGILQINWVYSENIHHPATIETQANVFMDQVRRLFF
ncbi:amino acid adenylation domain protein [Leptolyngbya sp. Heron Island J]|uniref:non-ribosomal peptide synthetase n=1 Tax=Leptolyngbya sp. Heron Island J TaxID=1385935 RepID=UPI0003B95701|nr:non-ribosomal peptide synthetase [Leptolyngbya sp. Heron Island J]ESA36656.1 amino acid adenylation domain protein [Leptolyngbya sp. Heron Island J]